MTVRSASVVALSLLCSAATLFAVPIYYGDLSGNNVAYQQITEDSSTDPTPLYGAPSVAGDSLLFSPVSFGANASGAGGLDFTDGTLATTVVALGNNGIQQLQFAERGDYTLAGTGTSATSVSVAAALFVRITHVNGAAIAAPVTFTANMLFNPSNGTYDLIADPGMGVIWQGGVALDLDAALAQAGYSGRATQVDVSLDNSLLAFSEAGTIAYIKKKQIDGVSVTAVVPEPSTLALAGLGIAGFAFVARRRLTR